MAVAAGGGAVRVCIRGVIFDPELSERVEAVRTGEAGAHRGVASEALREHADMTLNDGEHVVEIMGYAASELSDGFHLLRLA